MTTPLHAKQAGTSLFKPKIQTTNGQQQATTASSPHGRISIPTPTTMANAAVVDIVWVLLWFSSHFVASLLPPINDNTPRPSSTMGIQTCNSTNKYKSQKSAANVNRKQ
jgi:hypothetical protein